MASHLYIIDLDRTAFDTRRFSGDIIALLERQFGIPDATFRSAMKEYSHPGELGYDFYSHVQAATKWSPIQIDQLIDQHLGHQDYSYADIEPWLQARTAASEPVLILTVGEIDYQDLKLRHAQRLSRLPREVVRENKGRLLRAGKVQLSGFDCSSVTIIDDNPKTFEELGPQANIEQIYISRPGEKFAGLSVPPHVATISSFGDLL